VLLLGDSGSLWARRPYKCRGHLHQGWGHNRRGRCVKNVLNVLVAYYGHADHTSAEATSTKAGAITVVGGVFYCVNA